MDRKTREALETFASAVKKKLKEKFWKEHLMPAEDFAREKGYRRGIMDDVFMILDLARIQGWCETGAILWHTTDDEPCYESKTGNTDPDRIEEVQSFFRPGILSTQRRTKPCDIITYKLDGTIGRTSYDFNEGNWEEVCKEFDFWAYADELLPGRDGGCKDPQFLRYPVLQHKV